MYLNCEGINSSLAQLSVYDCGMIPPKRDMNLILHCPWAVDHVSCQREFRLLINKY